jgi:hypothetical protein
MGIGPRLETRLGGAAPNGLSLLWTSYTTSLIGKEVRHGTGTSIGFG